MSRIPSVDPTRQAGAGRAGSRLLHCCLLLACAGLALLQPACGPDSRIFGYAIGNQALYDTHYKTIRVPIFANRTYYRGVEFMLTDQIVKAIELNTPWKVVAGDADMELTGTIMTFGKNLILPSIVNELREGEVVMVVNVTWKDLHTGKLLSKLPRRPGSPIADSIPSVDDEPPPGGPLGPPTPGMQQSPLGTPVPVANPPVAPGGVGGPGNFADGIAPNGRSLTPSNPGLPAREPGIPLRVTADFVPELGQSFYTAQYDACRKMARQVVNLMEKPW